MSSQTCAACPPVAAPRRRLPATWSPAPATVRHRRSTRRVAVGGGRCAEADDGLRVLVGRAPRPRASAAAGWSGWTEVAGGGLEEQLTSGLALLAAVVMLVAAIWWMGCAPAL